MNMSNHGYGEALYYPYIHLQDENWLKVAALYYDKLRRIVPENFRTQDSHIVKSLNDKFQFIEDINPREGGNLARIANDFRKFAREELSDPNERNDLLAKIKERLPPDSGFRIHEEKIEPNLLDQLVEWGLAKKTDMHQPWFDFEPVTGAMYMTFLAERIAEHNGLPVVTDDPVFQHLIWGSQFDRPWRRRADTGYALASFVIKSAIPENIESVSLEKIENFRENHSAKRHDFYDEIGKLAKEISETDNPKAIKRSLNYHKTTIDNAVDKLKISFRDVGIGCVSGMLGLTLPAWVSSLSQMGPIGVQVASGGIFCMAAGIVVREGLNVLKSRRDSPWSYILSLKRDLSSDNFLKSLLRGVKIL